MNFEYNEKTAIVKIITDLMKADGVLHPNEMKFLEQLKIKINFDIPEVELSEDLDKANAYKILQVMNKSKKEILLDLLDEVAHADGFLHKSEAHLISETITALGLGNLNR